MDPEEKATDVTTPAEPEKPEDDDFADLSDLADLAKDEPVREKAAPLEVEQKPVADEPKEETEEKTEQPKKSGKKWLVLGSGIIVVAAVLLAVRFIVLPAREASKEKQIPAQTITPSPTEAPRKTVERSEWSLEVLNGSGVSGAAKKLAEQLTILGYQVVKTGNASKSDYTDTEVLVKNELLDQTDLLILDLKDVIRIASQSGGLTDSTASARIIIGKDQI